MKIVDADGTKRDVDVFFDKVSTGGRPRKVLTEQGAKLIESLAGIMCTDEEIASILSCGRDVFYTEDNAEVYRQATEKGRANGKASLRREQWKLAKKGNASMLIWLGKQWLNQKDKVETTNNFEDLTTLADLLKLKETQNNDTDDTMETV